ncbi:hypothetical protein ACJQWK_11621 [Exserohilum turcicum]
MGLIKVPFSCQPLPTFYHSHSTSSAKTSVNEINIAITAYKSLHCPRIHPNSQWPFISLQCMPKLRYTRATRQRKNSTQAPGSFVVDARSKKKSGTLQGAKKMMTRVGLEPTQISLHEHFLAEGESFRFCRAC